MLHIERSRALVLAPSDVAGQQLEPDRALRIGGRIDWAAGNEIVLADAFASLRLQCASSVVSKLTVGSLTVLRVVWHREGLTVEAVEELEAFPPPRGGEEWSRSVWSGKAKRLAARDLARRAMRSWFEDQGFVETDTPTWLQAPGLDSGVEAIAAESGWLVTSPEHCMKRLLVGGIPRLYQFAKCFRREELGPRHEPEFVMLEWYRAFSDLNQILDDTESLVLASAAALGVVSHFDWGGRSIRLERPFLRLTVAEAFRLHAGVTEVDELAKSDRNRYFQLFVDRVEPGLAQYDRPVFLHAYPAAEAALARISPEDPRWAERAELYIAGVELCNGYGELNAATEQRARFRTEIERRSAEGAVTYPMDERFLSALEQGMPPSAGNALGFDRLVMLLVGAATLQDVIAFPRSEL